jgi:hypothetical protein
MLRHALFAAGAVALLGAATTAPILAPGVTFTIRSSTEGNPAEQVSKVRFLNGVIRFDVEDAKDAKKAKANNGVGYVLVDSKARSVAMVMPEMQKYMEVKFDSTAGMVMQAMAMNSYVTDIDVSSGALGAGGVVNGVATRRYRITMSYKTADNGRNDLQNLCSVKSVEEFWVSDQLKDFPDPTEAMARAFGGMGQKTQMPSMGGVGGAGELMRKRAAAQQKLFNGIPVRSKWTNEESCPGKEAKSSNGQTDITDIQKADLDPADFKVPAGFTKLDMQSLEGMKSSFKDALRGGGVKKGADATQAGATEKDTSSIVDAAKDGAKEAAKEAGKEAAKAKINDAGKKLFGKFKKP